MNLDCVSDSIRPQRSSFQRRIRRSVSSGRDKWSSSMRHAALPFHSPSIPFTKCPLNISVFPDLIYLFEFKHHDTELAHRDLTFFPAKRQRFILGLDRNQMLAPKNKTKQNDELLTPLFHAKYNQINVAISQGEKGLI